MKINRDSVMDPFKKLPLEAAFEILTRVPAETVLDCKSVCRDWRKVVRIVSRYPEFIQKHLYHLNHPSAARDSCKLGFLALTECSYYYFEYNDDQNHELTEPIKTIREIARAYIGVASYSCNGLICLAQYDIEEPVWIFNPLTREYVMLPKIRNPIDPFDDSDDSDDSLDKRCDWDDWSFGFGYISATNEYKVVAIYGSSDSGYLEVYIYTIGSGNGWRDLGRNFSHEFRPKYGYGDIHGSFANGAIYWIGNEVQKIVIFDLVEEKFCQHLAPPPLPPNTNLIQQTIGVLDGVLYIAIYVEEGCFDVWLLKEKNDNHDNKGDKHQSFEWSKEFRVNDNGLIAATKSGGVLTYCNNDYYLNICNTNASTSEILWDFKDDVVLQVFPHKHTFVSLKKLGEKQTKKLKSVKGGR